MASLLASVKVTPESSDILKETVIQWRPENDSHLMGLQYHCHFVGTSSDEATAFFTIGATSQHLFRNTPLLASPRLNFGHFQGLMQHYKTVQPWHKSAHNPPVISRIGTQLNNTMMTDIDLPNLQFQPNSWDMSLNWIELLSAFYHEQLMIAKLKRENGRAYTSLVQLPTSRPAIFPTSVLHGFRNFGLHQLWEQCRALRPRYRSYYAASNLRCPSDIQARIQYNYLAVKQVITWTRAGELTSAQHGAQRV
ncbi:hypothetical protein EK21DRAFT_114934 [Setomelanomma holmii]|uniref:Uncharacterized protein n=1 Tax=Setomelanomma holmii TaxID=210430 RepID=A0A9P4H555_9PLEO|nr:hypothetical protein EK21DRAFT_114934 [Setomelanomma holmii]